MKSKLIVIAVAVIGIVIVAGYAVGSNFLKLAPQPQNETPDISRVTIESTNPDWRMVATGIVNPMYRFTVFLSIRINNPTQYEVVIRIYGECEFTITTNPDYFQAGTYSYDKTVDFILPAYTKDTYTLVLHEEAGLVNDPNSIKTLQFNSYHIDEMKREVR